MTDHVHHHVPERAEDLVHGPPAIARDSETVAAILERLHSVPTNQRSDGVVIVDDEGSTLGDLTILDLVNGAPTTTAAALLPDEGPVTVEAGTSLPDTFDLFTESPRSSIIVVDAAGRPIGRIAGVDLVRALDTNHHRPGHQPQH
jgi:Mg/Co/Ni transporter MgtE